MISLTQAQATALKQLGKPGHYRVNWHPKLSTRGYDGLKSMGLIVEQWTWASTTRPDVGITETGVRALSERDLL